MDDAAQEATTSRTWKFITALLPYAVLFVILTTMGMRDWYRTHNGLRAAFVTPDNLRSIASDCAPIIIAAVGMTLVIVSGGIDLSVGSTMGVAGAIAGAWTNHFQNAPSGLLMGILTGLACGLFNGLLIVGLRVPPFIATLGTLMSLRGICILITKGSIFIGDQMEATVASLVRSQFTWIFNEQVPGLGFSVSYVLVALIVGVFWVILNHTKLGRRIFAIGSNEDAARLSGVQVAPVKIGVYALGGLLAGIAGIVLAARVGGPAATTAEGYELQIIAAVVIGGASLSGGQGTLSGCVIGALLMSVLNNACTSFQVPDAYQKVIIGMFLVAAVALDQFRREKLKA